MKKYVHFFLYGIIIVSTNCSYTDYRFRVVNNASYSIAIATSRDTVFSENFKGQIAYYESHQARPGMEWQVGMPPTRDGWSDYISLSENRKLNLFIVDIDSLKKYQDWDILIEKEICERYSFSEEELDQMDWKVKYPQLFSDSLNHIPTSKSP